MPLICFVVEKIMRVIEEEDEEKEEREGLHRSKNKRYSNFKEVLQYGKRESLGREYKDSKN